MANLRVKAALVLAHLRTFDSSNHIFLADEVSGGLRRPQATYSREDFYVGEVKHEEVLAAFELYTKSGKWYYRQPPSLWPVLKRLLPKHGLVPFMSEHKDCFDYEVRDGKLRGFQYTSPDGGWPKPAQKAGQPLAAKKAKGSPPLPAQDAKGSLAVGGSSPAKETHLDSSTAFGNSQPLAAPSAPMAAASSSEPSPPLAPP